MSDSPQKPATPSLSQRLRGILGGNARAVSLVPRERRFYDLFEKQAETLVRSAGLLEQALADAASLPARQREIKDLEHRGDELTHEIIRALNTTFVTPSTARTSTSSQPGSTISSTISRRSPTRPTCTASRPFPTPLASWRGSLHRRWCNSSRRSASSSPARGAVRA